ncbi:MAG TPA: peptidase T, partial [Solirubrobacteraceae bacterium]|nr:peptidase T [Solirubrobacteraceae bacterium]
MGGPPTNIFTSGLAEALAPDLLERFQRYVRVDTQSSGETGTEPSTPGQLDLGRLLVEELQAIGLDDAAMDDGGFTFATLFSPPTSPDGPVIGLLAHVDTTPEVPGAGVEPIVHRGYDGGAIELPRGGTVLDPAAMPVLASKAGHDIVTSSGDTLLGADDKAGVAEIMAAVAHLAAHPELPRPTLRVGFTPDEEIGVGATRFDIERFGATCAYTLDGSQPGELQDESFSAKGVTVTFTGVDVHPGWATGKLVNAARLAGQFLAALPPELSPEATADREGFVHPYEGTVATGRATIKLIARDFDDARLDEHVEVVRRAAEEVVAGEPRARVDVEV